MTSAIVETYYLGAEVENPDVLNHAQNFSTKAQRQIFGDSRLMKNDYFRLKMLPPFEIMPHDAQSFVERLMGITNISQGILTSTEFVVEKMEVVTLANKISLTLPIKSIHLGGALRPFPEYLNKLLKDLSRLNSFRWTAYAPRVFIPNINIITIYVLDKQSYEKNCAKLKLLAQNSVSQPIKFKTACPVLYKQATGTKRA